jgi:hypothetical protein
VKTNLTILSVAILLSGMTQSVVLAEGGRDKHAQDGTVFPLKLQPLPGTEMGGFGWWGSSLSPLNVIPEGVKGDEAVSAKLRLSRKGSTEHQVVLTKSKGQARFERLYIDANANGRFEEGECYDLSRPAGPVTTTARGVDYREIKVRPVKITGLDGAPGSARWIGLMFQERQQRPESFLLYTSITAAMGKVKLGDKEVSLALYERLPFDSGNRLDKRVEMPAADAPKDARAYLRSATQLMLDLDEKDRWIRQTSLTRLIKSNGRYYELKVAEDARSIRVKPVEPQVGMLNIPPSLKACSILGPELAADATPKDKQIELPVGRYVVYHYVYPLTGSQLYGSDVYARNVFEIRAGQATSIEVGPPLELRLSHSWSWAQPASRGKDPPNTLSFRLEAFDRAGRQVSGIYLEKGGRPPAPQFKILDDKGKTIHTGTFEFG